MVKFNQRIRLNYNSKNDELFKLTHGIFPFNTSYSAFCWKKTVKHIQIQKWKHILVINTTTKYKRCINPANENLQKYMTKLTFAYTSILQ